MSTTTDNKQKSTLSTKLDDVIKTALARADDEETKVPQEFMIYKTASNNFMKYVNAYAYWLNTQRDPIRDKKMIKQLVHEEAIASWTQFKNSVGSKWRDQIRNEIIRLVRCGRDNEAMRRERQKMRVDYLLDEPAGPVTPVDPAVAIEALLSMNGPRPNGKSTSAVNASLNAGSLLTVATNNKYTTKNVVAAGKPSILIAPKSPVPASNVTGGIVDNRSALLKRSQAQQALLQRTKMMRFTPYNSPTNHHQAYGFPYYTPPNNMSSSLISPNTQSAVDHMGGLKLSSPPSPSGHNYNYYALFTNFPNSTVNNIGRPLVPPNNGSSTAAPFNGTGGVAATQEALAPRLPPTQLLDSKTKITNSQKSYATNSDSSNSDINNEETKDGEEESKLESQQQLLSSPF
jgi:hypothetical protein